MKKGDIYTSTEGHKFKITNPTGFCGLPVGTIADGSNKGISVILCNAITVQAHI